jgi:hypothetical protein
MTKDEVVGHEMKRARHRDPMADDVNIFNLRSLNIVDQ